MDFENREELGMLRSFSWYINRFRAMSIKEIPYRINQKRKDLTYKKMYRQSATIKNIESLKIHDINSAFLKRLEKLTNDSNFEVGTIQQEYNIFNQKIDLYSKIEWHNCTINQWPKKEYSRKLSFANKDNIGEIRYTWEINRMQFLPLMAVNYIECEKEEVLNQIKFHFYDWLSENPFLNGVNWSSPMEIAIRAYQWLYVLVILKDHIDDQFQLDLIKAIINSIDYVMSNLSLYSSANNHLILEAAISSIIGWVMYPIYKQNWFEEGYAILKRELPIQTFEDGVNKEQAVHYHAFVLDMMLQYNSLLKKINRVPICDELIYKMARYIGVLKCGGSAIEFGDSDDAKILCFQKIEDYYNYLLFFSSVYYGESFSGFNKSYIRQIGFFVDKASLDVHEKVNYGALEIFKSGGYSFINEGAFFMGFDTGTLGFGSIAAHGHADALSIVLNYNKKEIFVDPGTYIYNVEAKWRDYFRKTSSHNTLVYNNKDQSTMEGNFLWGKKANSKLIASSIDENFIHLMGEHDGYSPLVHKRDIKFLRKHSTIVITDLFQEEGELNFHLSNDVEIKQISDKHIVINNVLNVFSSEKISIKESYISKAFRTKIGTKCLNIKNDFLTNPRLYTIISDEILSIDEINLKIKENLFTINEKL
ncbi:hypothetical protein COL41_04175 [Bacillus mycoides]|uniref:alginate lyase family protein n=1 Tax=Bacillus mycoides TaxID=1405 RepID=UPI000BF70C31|nr:alginate lyase family protein [Bacillus mycoides]PFX98196.1 hypothetical protein COL41_04175 [Bacillus mycoides]QWH03512.1 alginate lyase family protein [Bacillus mycoides]